LLNIKKISLVSVKKLEKSLHAKCLASKPVVSCLIVLKKIGGKIG
jgi:hypothetical protein